MSVTKAMLPLLKKDGGRIIFVSSAVGKTYLVPESQKRLLSPNLTAQELEEIMASLEHQVEGGSFVPPPNNVGGIAYGLGKMAGTTIYPRILASASAAEECYVTSCCPAFDGPSTPVWLATAPIDLIKSGHGGFWEMRELTDPSDWQLAMSCTFSTTRRYPPGHE